MFNFQNCISNTHGCEDSCRQNVVKSLSLTTLWKRLWYHVRYHPQRVMVSTRSSPSTRWSATNWLRAGIFLPLAFHAFSSLVRACLLQGRLLRLKSFLGGIFSVMVNSIVEGVHELYFAKWLLKIAQILHCLKLRGHCGRSM